MTPAVYITCILYVMHVSYGCKVKDFRSLSMEEILTQADLVVYGAERYRVSSDDPTAGMMTSSLDGMFEVYCVLKRGSYAGDIPAMMRLLRVAPVHTCQGTEYDNNTDIMLAVTPRDGHFAWHELNVTPDNMAILATPQNLARAMAVPELQHPELPTGRSSEQRPTCPAVGAGSNVVVHIGAGGGHVDTYGEEGEADVVDGIHNRSTTAAYNSMMVVVALVVLMTRCF